MENPFRFDPEKALETILFIAAKVPDTYHIGKIIYFADLQHLENYGRFISGDYYCALKDGPVPSGTYDIIKDVREDRRPRYELSAHESFSVDGYDVKPKRLANFDLFSKSDISCLETAIEKYGSLSFGKLKQISHDSAYDSADENGEISIAEIAKMLPNADDVIENLKESV